jgi:pilin isopeptide linkage protein
LKEALENQNSKIDIIITGSFELTEYARVNNKTVTIISDGLAERVISMNSAYNFQVRDGGNLILGDGSPLKLTGEVVGIVNVTDSGSLVVNDGVTIINASDKAAKFALSLSGANVTGTINGGYIKGYVALDVKNGAKIIQIGNGKFIGETSAVSVTGAGSRIEKITGGVFYGKTDVAIKTESSISLEPLLSDDKGITRFCGKDGAVANDASLLILPLGYEISTLTEPVSGIDGAEFRYLTRAAVSDINVHFPEICYSKAGVYEYTVRETSVSGDGWITDTREYPVIVTVTDDGKGNLTAHTEYPQGVPEFVNKYEPKSVCVKIIATKIAIGAPLKDGQFEFGVFDEHGNKVASAVNHS